jgi:hypothetical protein
MMIVTVFYLSAVTAGLLWALWCAVPTELTGGYPWIALTCGLIGGIGGCLYCLRGVYINKSVRGVWDPDWQVWYFVRPLASFLSGLASFLFIQAGLILLEASIKEGATQIGLYALAFVAGLNVDRFVSKIEEIAEVTWGIRKSRMAKSITLLSPPLARAQDDGPASGVFSVAARIGRVRVESSAPLIDARRKQR